MMPWVRFLKAFDFVIRDKLVLSYKPNRDYLVKQACAKEAVEKGSAIPIERPKKERDADQNHIRTGTG